MTSAVYSLDEAASRLGKSRRWFVEWLNANPCDQYWRPYYCALGRTKTFDDLDITRLRRALEAEAIARLGRNNDAKSDEGFVYFVGSGEFIKIGYSRSLKARFHKMETDLPEFELLHIEPGTPKQEKVFHRHFAEYRVRGEWFRRVDSLLEFIKRRKVLCGRGSE